MMKKTILSLFLAFSLVYCSMFRAKIAPYPSGIIFPLAVDEEIWYEGEIIEVVHRLGENLIFSTRKGMVYAINGTNRKKSWQFQCQKNLESPPYLGSEHIYVYDHKRTLYCLDQNGQLIWKKKLMEQLTGGIHEYRDRIYVGTAQGKFYALSADAGRKIWSYQAKGEVCSTPAAVSGMIMFGCDDHFLYFLNQEGKLIDRFQTGGEIRGSLTVDEGLLYFGSFDHFFYGLDLKKRKMKWKIKTGGNIHTHPIIYEKRLFFISMNNVLYCLHKRTGTILWWRAIPARSYYFPEVIEDKIVVSALSPQFLCFDIATGEEKGRHEAPGEIKANPVWVNPYLVINQYNRVDGSGKLVFMKKNVGVTLRSSKTSPQKINEEIVLTASVTGFYLAQYEFRLKHYFKVIFGLSFTVYVENKEADEIAQPKSKKNSWEWYPDKAGFYIITVHVTDEKEEAEAKLTFTIEGAENRKEN